MDLYSKNLIIDYVWQYSHFYANKLIECEQHYLDGRGYSSLILLFEITENICKSVVGDFDSSFYCIVNELKNQNKITEEEKNFLSTNKFSIRKIRNLYAHTFQGKIAEYVVYYCLRQYGFEVEEPDLGVFGENIWDNVDIDCNGRHISIKSTKERGQLLLLEKGDWNDQGCYIPNINDGGKMAQYDYHMLVRVRPSCEDILRNNRILYGSELPEEVIDILLNQSWEYCMPRYISRDELIYLIQNNFVIKAGSYFNKTKMDADNYYVKAYDMHELPEIINGLS